MFITFIQEEIMNSGKAYKRFFLLGLILLIFIPVSAQKPQPSKIDPEWWENALKNIQGMEYEASWQDECRIPGGFPGYHMANRAQNLRAYFYPEGIKIISRTQEPPSWIGEFCLKACGKKGALKKPEIPVIKPDKNVIEYKRTGFTETFENTEQGILHSFHIEQGMLQKQASFQLVETQAGKGLAIQQGIDEKTLDILHNGKTILHYTLAGAENESGQCLNADIEAKNSRIIITFYSAEATSDITVRLLFTGTEIKGLSSLADWSEDIDDTKDYNFGCSVSTAGDVNGDGYSEVIVGAWKYDNGESYEGAAFVFYGTENGLEDIPGWRQESNQVTANYGRAVCTAGDVNGDGYADVIVGAHDYDINPASATSWDEGRVYVYHGAASGLKTSADTTINGDQKDSDFGWAVGSAGDVNGDGYDDIIIGADNYTYGQQWEGRIYVHHGSSLGTNGNLSWYAEGNKVSMSLGTSVGTAGDVNGDGYDDIIAGAWSYTNGQTEEGAALVWHGSSSGLGNIGNPGNADWMTEGNAAWNRFGWSVNTAGDVNGDGYADVIVGAHQYSNGQGTEGRAYVYHGSASGLSTGSNWRMESNKADAEFGRSVCTAGDVNGDGYADVIIGAPGADKAYVYHGAASGLGSVANWTGTPGSYPGNFGFSVGSAGDVNGDGYADVLIGSTGAERAFVFHGSPNGGVRSSWAWQMQSNQQDAHMGYSVATAGDVNGDGFSDVIIGAPDYDTGQTDAGRVYVYYGNGLQMKASPWIEDGDQADAAFGYCARSAGDVNGDGYDDVIIGAPFYDGSTYQDVGRVYVYHGSSGGLAASAAFAATSTQASCRYGASVATAGDINADGYSDVIVGAPDYYNGELQEGIAFVFFGSSSGISASGSWMGESNQAYAHFGESVSTAGDVNGDGFADIVCGAWGYDKGDTDDGMVFAWYGSASGLGSDGTPLNADWSSYSGQNGARYGAAVGTAGDVNGDGYSDVIAGAYLYDKGNTDEGIAVVFKGSALGLASYNDWIVESNQDYAYFGISVGTAGDVNGDSYSDVIIGAYGYTNGQTSEGRAFVYHGSGSGLLTIPSWTAESNEYNAYFGISVGCAGDVNGDGFSDVICGTSYYDAGETDEGRVFLYPGNQSVGLALKPQQIQWNGISPIGPVGMADSEYTVRFRGRGRYPGGRSKAKIEWEVKSFGTDFTGSGMYSSNTWEDTGKTGVKVEGTEIMLTAGTLYHWRSRIVYKPGNRLGIPHSRWLFAPFNAPTEADFRTKPSGTPTPTATPTPTPTPTPQLYISGVQACEGGTAEVSINVTGASSMINFGFDLVFDNTKLTYNSASLGSAVSDWGQFDALISSPGVLSVDAAVIAGTTLNGSGTLVHVEFTVGGTPVETTPLTAINLRDGLSAAGVNNGEIVIYGKPTADFDGFPLSGWAPLEVCFSDLSDGNGIPLLQWEWDFDNDGSVDEGAQNPCHSFETPGSYSVKLTSINGCGEDEITKTDYITAKYHYPFNDPTADGWKPWDTAPGTPITDPLITFYAAPTTHHSSAIIIENNTSSNVFGFWEMKTDSPMEECEGDLLYRARYSLKTDQADTSKAPFLRLRWSDVSSLSMGGLYVDKGPNAPGTSYGNFDAYYFKAPWDMIGGTNHLLFFDLVDLTANQMGSAYCDSVHVTRYPAPSGGVLVLSYDSENDFQKWSAFPDVSPFDSVTSGSGGGSVWVETPGPIGDTILYYGGWGTVYEPSVPSFESGYLYEAVFTLRCDSPDSWEHCPMIRLRISNYTFNWTCSKDIRQVPGSFEHMPLPGGRAYSLFLDPPSYLTGTPGDFSDTIALSFDVVDGQDTEHGRVYLDKAEVYRYPHPFP